ncbi:MAG: hypothetical protein CVU07_07540 [Bacteroidetes bacterium HGW-Bacteroidetes-23]|nr:MAG: hypothetical protein CVU07_07540 [Bacteroidetes bacterium HGW-Bacteroidetes-23]
MLFYLTLNPSPSVKARQEGEGDEMRRLSGTFEFLLVFCVGKTRVGIWLGQLFGCGIPELHSWDFGNV